MSGPVPDPDALLEGEAVGALQLPGLQDLREKGSTLDDGTLNELRDVDQTALFAPRQALDEERSRTAHAARRLIRSRTEHRRGEQRA